MLQIKQRCFLVLLSLLLVACTHTTHLAQDTLVKPALPIVVQYTVKGSLTKRLIIELDNPEQYASISLFANGKRLLDRLNVAQQGRQKLEALVRFGRLGPVEITVQSHHADVTLLNLSARDAGTINVPVYVDISERAGLDKVSSIKYGGPTIADIDQDGDYDFIVNNHNQESSKLYWNNGDGTVSKHDKNLSRWFMHDLHGTAAGDYDNDGDLDIVVTQGGGNGRDPSKANFYTNNNGNLVLSTGDVGINRGGRGRGAKWSDMDMDGDLDLMLINETSLHNDKPQHFFHENLGDGTFVHRPIEGLQDQEPSRAMITDLNGDNVDDLVLYGPLSVWLGNGDFTFTDITHRFPAELQELHGIMAIADIDIDNDGDQDLYLARGKEFEHGFGEAPFVDHDPLTQEFSIKPRGYKGTDEFTFVAQGPVPLHDYYYLTQGFFRGKDYPIFLGKNKTLHNVNSGQDFTLNPKDATGWPQDITENGVYFGYLGNNKWRAKLVRNANIFWGYQFSLSGVQSIELAFEPENRNMRDFLLRNDGQHFTDVSREWGIQPGSNSLGVTSGDFNNDSHQDLLIYRWGNVGMRISDYMLLNDGQGKFHAATQHGANDVGGPGNGDMGQAFDFDLDGDLDLLNGSEGGEWYLYENQRSGQGHFALVRVGYSPQFHVDAISAEVIIKTPKNQYRKRVGSSGAVFSQSLLNIVHFGLGEEETIESIQVRWRNGETIEFLNKPANQLFDTNNVDPITLRIDPINAIREGAVFNVTTQLTPENANSKLRWWSDNESVIQVDQYGRITAVGQVGQSATLFAASPANGLTAHQTINIVEWFEKPVKDLTLSAAHPELVVGDTLNILAKVTPVDADHTVINWVSSHKNIVSVDEAGRVTAHAAGSAIITGSVPRRKNESAVNTTNKTHIEKSIKILVKSRVSPFIDIINADEYLKSAFTVGEKITLEVKYHAGTGNKVIASDEGGIRFWLRHFKSKWIPVRDIILTDSSVIKTESGSSTRVISLEGLTPTADLPEGHFYQLRASFANSEGEVQEATIYPLNIVAKDDSEQ